MTNVNFQSIPTLDYSLATHDETRYKFVAQLRDVIINVGFLYLENTPVDKDIISNLKAQIPHLFALPQEQKDCIRMANSPHFLGYSKLGMELTKGAVDYREQFDFGTPCISSYKPGDPEYWNIYGPSQVCYA